MDKWTHKALNESLLTVGLKSLNINALLTVITVNKNLFRFHIKAPNESIQNQFIAMSTGDSIVVPLQSWAIMSPP
jgi:hypothetical protein